MVNTVLFFISGVILQGACIFLVDDRIVGFLLSLVVAFPFYYGAAEAWRRKHGL